MDAPGTEGRRQHNLSTMLFCLAVALLVLSVALVLAMPATREGDPENPALFSLGLWLTTPASAILWAFSFQAIRRRPAVSLLAVPAGYIWGWSLFLSIAVNLNRVWH